MKVFAWNANREKDTVMSRMILSVSSPDDANCFYGMDPITGDKSMGWRISFKLINTITLT